MAVETRRLTAKGNDEEEEEDTPLLCVNRERYVVKTAAAVIKRRIRHKNKHNNRCDITVTSATF
jgi:hypothetical protein